MSGESAGVPSPAWLGDPECGVCKRRRIAVGLASTTVRAHWRHPRGADCPLVLWERRGERDFESEPEAVAARRAEACRAGNLGRSYVFALHAFGKGNLPVLLFADLLREADRRHLWALKGVAPWNLPYRLAVLRDAYDDSRGGPRFAFRLRRRSKDKRPSEFLEKIDAETAAYIWRCPFAFWKFKQVVESEDAAWYAGSGAERVIVALSAELLKGVGNE